MSDHEHSDGELGEVPSATVATPSLTIGNVAGIRKGYGPRPDATSAAGAASAEEFMKMRRAFEEENVYSRLRKLLTRKIATTCLWFCLQMPFLARKPIKPAQGQPAGEVT